MNEKNVLIIAYYFPPMGLSGVQRTLKFVKYLPDFNWKPIVLTTNPSSFFAFDESLNKEINEESVKIYRTIKDSSPFANSKKNNVLKFPSYFTQKLGRFLLSIFYQPDTRIKWKKYAIELGNQIIKEQQIDVIFATAPPFTDFLVAKELSAKHNIPFIIDYRDIWVDNPFHSFPTPFHKLYSSRLESEILTHTQKAVVTTRHTKELLLKRYKFLNHDDIKIINHGFDPQDFEPYKDVKPSKKKMVITHSGLFQDNRTPKYFFKGLASFIKNNPKAADKVEARFIGIMRKEHTKLIKKYQLQTVVNCIGYVEHNETVKNLLESDILWLMLNDTVRSPGKLYEYLGARKPILVCCPEGEIKSTAIGTKATIATDPKDSIAIEKAIKTFYDLWLDDNLPVPNEKFIDSYNRIRLTEELSKVLSLAIEV